MVSSDGLKTWFDYEILFLKITIACMLVIAAWSRLVAYLGSLPLADLGVDPADQTVALAVTGGGILVIFLLVVLAGLLNRDRQ